MAIDIDTHLRHAGVMSSTITRGDSRYEDARQGFNTAVSQYPAAVAYPRDAAEVASLVSAARTAGLRVAVQGGAHNAGPQGSLEDALLLRTNLMDGVEIDPVTRTARVEAGVLWEAVVDAAAPHGLAALHGSSPDVGVVGYSLSGGLGWLARRHGLQTNRITAADLVTADGDIVRVDAEREPELFWALRGGGGNFGIVTALEFELLPLTEAYAGWLAWDWTDSERVLQRWAEWAPDATENVTTAARILQLPPTEDVPEPVRGRKLVVIDGAVIGDPCNAAAVLEPLRELKPEIDTFASVPMPALSRLHGDPEEPMPYVSDTAMLGELPPQAAAEFVAAAGPDSGSILVLAELRQLGGAINRPQHGALSHFDGAFLAFALGVAPDIEVGAVSLAQARNVMDALKPWRGGRPYLNFVEEEFDASAGFTEATFMRLCEIRAQVDPTGLFRANHVIA